MGVLSDTWTLHGSAWGQSSAGPGARDSHRVATLGGKVVLFGGNAGGGAPLDDTWTFDGTRWLRAPASGPSARWDHGMAPLP